MEIFVKTLAGETIAVEVESADTTDYVKAKALHISASSSSPGNVIPPPDQRYCLVSAAGEQLERGRTLADHGIVQDGATLGLVLDPEPPMQITVKQLNQTEFTLDDVHGSDSIYAVKTKIHHEQGISAWWHSLVYGRRLVSGRTLASYGVQDKTTIFSVFNLGGIERQVKWIKIFVGVVPLPAPAPGAETEGRKGFDIVVESTDTVGVVKETIQEQEGIPASQQRLVLTGKQMDDDGRTVAEYNVTENSDIRLVIRPLRSMRRL